MKKIIGFTLAEIIIVILIIGIIAAATIPTLVNNNQKQKLKVGLEQGYSIANQAIKRMEADGINPYNDFDFNNPDEFYAEFKSYFNIALDCPSYKCNGAGVTTMYKNLTNTNVFYLSTFYWTTSTYVLNNDMLILVSRGWLSWWDSNHGGPIQVFIDVNGYKNKPNIAGKDLFIFELMPNNKLVPEGTKGTEGASYASPCSSSGTGSDNGFNCTYWAILDKSPDDPTQSYWNDFLP